MRIRFLIIVVVATSIAALTACSSEDTRESTTVATAEPSGAAETDSSATGKSPKSSSDTAENAAVQVIDTAFMPRTIRIPAGTRVNWKQIGDQAHSVTATDMSFDSSPGCGPLHSERCLGLGDTFSHDFEEAGTFAYYCRVHALPDGSGMTGTIIVK